MRVAPALRTALRRLDGATSAVDGFAVERVSRVLALPPSRRTPLRRIANTALHVGLTAGGAVGGVTAAGLLVTGVGNPVACTSEDAFTRALGFGILGIPDRYAVDAYAGRRHKNDTKACCLLGAAVAARGLAFLPRMAVRLAMAVGLVAGGLAGALVGGLVQLGIEAGTVGAAHLRRHQAARRAEAARAAFAPPPAPTPAPVYPPA